MPQLTVELHCHTYWSRDSLMLPARLLEICRRRGIDRLAITDHNTIDGALEAAALDPVRVIVGEEIMTTQGEILAYYLREAVPPGLTPKATIARLRNQGALISVSHPFDSLRGGSWDEPDLRSILPQVDALEVFNARTWSGAPNRRAASFCAAAGLLRTAGSDAHAYCEVGRARMRLAHFGDATSMRLALAQAEIVAHRSTPAVHLLSRLAKWRKRLGWRPPGPGRRAPRSGA